MRLRELALAKNGRGGSFGATTYSNDASEAEPAGIGVALRLTGGTGEYMNTMKTQTKPRAARKRKAAPPIVTPLALPGLVALFGRIRTKVRFPDRETAVRGYGVLSRSGHAVEAFGNYTFGCGSAEQVELLNRAGVRYEVVE